MTEIDSAAFEAGEASCSFSQDNLSASGSSPAAHFSDSLGRVYVTARARLLSPRPQAGHTQPALTLVVEDSANGSSWATVASFDFTASDQQSAAVDSPRAYLRASWEDVAGTWAVDVAVKSIATPASGGGSTPVVGAHAHMFAPLDPYDGSNIAFSTRDYDSDGFWDVTNQHITIPAGLGGLYLIQCGIIASPVSDNIIGATCDIAIGDTLWNLDPLSFDMIEAVVGISAGVFRGSVSAILPLSDTCALAVQAYWKGDSGFGPPGPDGAISPGSYLGVFRQGDLAP